MSKNVNMTEAELNSVDAMIAYLEASDKRTMDKSFDALFANNNCFGVMAMTNTSTCISGWIGANDVFSVVSAADAATGGKMKANDTKNASFFEKLSDGKKEITLDELIAIRNNNH